MDSIRYILTDNFPMKRVIQEEYVDSTIHGVHIQHQSHYLLKSMRVVCERDGFFSLNSINEWMINRLNNTKGYSDRNLTERAWGRAHNPEEGAYIPAFNTFYTPFQ